MCEPTCSVVENGKRCTKPVKNKTRGWCGMHYQRWWTHGDPLARRLIFGSAEERFWHYVNKRGPGECWPWGGTIKKNGYGQIWADGKNTSPHIVAYRLAGHVIPNGLQLDHTCHDPDVCAPGDSCPHRRCCNPAHLEPVTGAVNTLRSGALPAQNARKDTCSRGHLFDEANTGWSVYRSRTGVRRQRYCRACRRDKESTPEGRAKKAAQAKARYARNKAAAKAAA